MKILIQLLNLINELEIDKIHLVGFSLGSLIARHFASIHGYRLSSLVLHGSIYKRSEDQNELFKIGSNSLKLIGLLQRSSYKKMVSEDYIKIIKTCMIKFIQCWMKMTWLT